jgi:hypothetical protein
MSNRRAKPGTGEEQSMKRQLLIQNILETWVNQLPVEADTGASIATKEDIVRLSEELASQLGEPDEGQTGHWLSLLVQLYTQARFEKQRAVHQSNNPSIRSSVVP